MEGNVINLEKCRISVCVYVSGQVLFICFITYSYFCELVFPVAFSRCAFQFTIDTAITDCFLQRSAYLKFCYTHILEEKQHFGELLILTGLLYSPSAYTVIRYMFITGCSKKLIFVHLQRNLFLDVHLESGEKLILIRQMICTAIFRATVNTTLSLMRL